MTTSEMTARAYEEAQRLLENCFSFHNPYTCIIEDEGIPFGQREEFYGKVEEELAKKGEKIKREGKYFKIVRYNER